jgi:acyl-CoA synthetase (AMP-forming)/AMP-acid ligase II
MKSTALRLKQCLTRGVVLKIVDEHDREVPSETVGKIITRGPHVMPGDWNKRKRLPKPSGICANDENSGPSALSLCSHTVSGSIWIVRWSWAEAIIASVTCTTRKPSRPLAAGSRPSRMAW